MGPECETNKMDVEILYEVICIFFIFLLIGRPRTYDLIAELQPQEAKRKKKEEKKRYQRRKETEGREEEGTER